MEHNSQKHTLLITGSSGYVGEMLVDQFSKRDDVVCIVGIDISEPSELIRSNPKFVFVKANLGDTDWQSRVEAYAPSIVIHTAWQIREMKDKAEQKKRNITASDNVFKFVFENKFVKKLVHFSTVSSYGAFADNKIDWFFTEDREFRKTDYFYAEEKRIVEEHLASAHHYWISGRNKETDKKSVYIIRPASITGPRGRFMRVKFGLQSVLSGQLKNEKSFWHRLISMMTSFTPITKNWSRQYVHEDDITDIVALLALDGISSEFEVFNAAPHGSVVTGPDMARAVGKKAITLHPQLVRFVFFVVRNISFGRIPTSVGAWKTYSYPIVVDGSKITHQYGYQYRADSYDAFTKTDGRYQTYVR